MDIIPISYPLQNLPLTLNTQLSLAIGHFDGVHKGHQNVIGQAVKVAQQNNMRAAVMTFTPHPKAVLGRGAHYDECLTPLHDKTAIFAKLGVEVVFVMKFDLQFASVSPEQFIDEVIKKLNVKHITVGFDFRFGSRGAGDPAMLKELCLPQIGVSVVEPLFDNGQKVSSTFTRQLLKEGDLKHAERLLGRPYTITGTVERGDGRGSTIGFPTANLRFNDPYAGLKLGVYAIKAEVNGKMYGGVLNYGIKPTFNKEDIKPVMEAHLFDFNQDIYGEAVTVHFIDFIRSEQRFGSVAELIAQINKDAETAKSIVSVGR
ncbi:bifunctional riboflavin kinase/FAD synthetase [Paenibacillus sp. GXUN7292]|uniref:bifunctional riboflavin kinase/FAD synthetase n=1 Tax=Paenibacillus sp. GXUN7292 TaxID=3422499 RepID=UPI003D7E3B3E